MLFIKYVFSYFSMFISKKLLKKERYRVFDNGLQRVGGYCPDQKASLELNTGGKISLSLVHFDILWSQSIQIIFYIAFSVGFNFNRKSKYLKNAHKII